MSSPRYPPFYVKHRVCSTLRKTNYIWDRPQVVTVDRAVPTVVVGPVFGVLPCNHRHFPYLGDRLALCSRSCSSPLTFVCVILSSLSLYLLLLFTPPPHHSSPPLCLHPTLRSRPLSRPSSFCLLIIPSTFRTRHVKSPLPTILCQAPGVFHTP